MTRKPKLLKLRPILRPSSSSISEQPWSESPTGVTLQVYCAIIAALLIGLWTGTKPNKRTYEMLCHYFGGWATAEELERHLHQLQQKTTGPPSNS